MKRNYGAKYVGLFSEIVYFCEMLKLKGFPSILRTLFSKSECWIKSNENALTDYRKYADYSHLFVLRDCFEFVLHYFQYSN